MSRVCLVYRITYNTACPSLSTSHYYTSGICNPRNKLPCMLVEMVGSHLKRKTNAIKPFSDASVILLSESSRYS